MSHETGQTLQETVQRLARYGRRPALGQRLEIGLRWWSYDRLHQESLRAAKLLQSYGVRKGDRVMIAAPNCPEWVSFFFGAVLLGAVFVPVDDDSDSHLIRRIAKDVGTKLLLSAHDRAGTSMTIIDIGSLPAIRLEDSPDITHPVAPEDPAIVFYTSGTTSSPRGVVLTHGNLVSQIKRFRRWHWLTRIIAARLLVMAPLSHSQGLLLGVCIPLSIGLSAVYVSNNHPSHLIRTLRDNRITLLSTVPRVAGVLAKAFAQIPYRKSRVTLGKKLEGAKFWFLRRHYSFNAIHDVVGYRFWIILVGGAPLPKAIEAFWRDAGFLLVQGYGLTETAAMVTVGAPFLEPWGSVGKPLPDQDVKIAPDGEILVRGPNVMEGYYGADPAKTDPSEGFFHTGDVGRLDRRNRLFVLGRKKDVIVTGEGFNVWPRDVETVLNALPGVKDSVILGLDHEGHTQIHAALLLEPGADDSELVRVANRRLPPYQRIRGFTRWPDKDFPRSALLKIRRDEVAEKIGRPLEEPGTPPERAESRPDSIAAVVQIKDKEERLDALARYLAGVPAEKLATERIRLVRDLDLSSLDTVELLFRLEQRSGAMLDHIVVDEEITLQELKSLVSDPYQEQKVKARYTRNPPRWAELPLLNPVRRILNPLVLGSWVRLRTRLQVEGLENLTNLEPPFILSGMGHEHAFDVLLVYCSLPPRLRRKISLITSRWVFIHFLEPQPHVTRLQRLLVAVGFKLLVPLFFPLVLTPHFGTTRAGLMEAARLIDRGYSPIVFEGGALELLSRQCGVPTVPVRLEGNEGVDFALRAHRSQVKVIFEHPIRYAPALRKGR